MVPEQLGVLGQSEAFKIGNVLTGIEGGHDEDKHGQIQKEEDQSGIDFIQLFHTMTLPSLSLPANRFISHTHRKMSSISTRDRAAPKLGLLALLN